ncbi:DUF4192 domain-containing protein [Streptomyces sp. NPDC096142]|uniref:DUF4192 domain-containing protein n=1 Tax=Streptomyces sp. NPDC096142 TaxID=3366077 RepID=UPI0038228CAE
MTNHSETTGSSENGDIGPTAYDRHSNPEHQLTLRSPAELADALPYLLGYRPEDSIVLVALHDRAGRGRFGGRARLGIPTSADDWASVARQLAHGLVTGSERRGTRPEQMIAYVCQEPAPGESGRQVMERLRPLVQKLRTECGRLDVTVIEALCISDGRFWSYCCSGKGCCPVDGSPMGLPGTSVLAAAATYAGLQVRGTLRELRARLLPWETAAALQQEVALDAAGMTLVPKLFEDASRAEVAEDTLDLARRIMKRFALAPCVTGVLHSDFRDDALLAHDEAAHLILGLQDRTTRDRAAAWMEGDDALPALRLWRALARRCVGPYGEHAAAPLTLAGWVAWSTGDDLEAREALAMALGADPDYLFARLLHQACNEGLDPESIRRCLRAERVERAEGTEGAEVSGAEGATRTGEAPADPEAADSPVGQGTSTPAEAPTPAAPPTAPSKASPTASPTPSRRRHRARTPDLDGVSGRLRPSGTDNRRSGGTDGSRPRTPAQGTARPGGTRARTSGKGGSRRYDTCTEGAQPEANGMEGDR